MAAQAALAREMNPLQKLIFSAAVRDPVTAERVEAFAARAARVNAARTAVP
jgi:hypothetical protein